MVRFKCKRSGNVISFSNPDDIAGLRKHEGYEEIQDGMQVERQKASEEVRIEKRRGRPRKSLEK